MCNIFIEAEKFEEAELSLSRPSFRLKRLRLIQDKVRKSLYRGTTFLIPPIITLPEELSEILMRGPFLIFDELVQHDLQAL